MNVMNKAWLLLKENVATTHTEYGDHMPEIKPHPAAVSYAQRAGYQPDGKAYPGLSGAKSNTATTQVPNAPPMMGVGQGALPGRKIQLMPRPKPPQEKGAVNMQSLGLDPRMGDKDKRRGRQMMSIEEKLDGTDMDSRARQIYDHNEDVQDMSRNTIGQDFRQRHYKHRDTAEANLGPIGDAMTQQGTMVTHDQPLGDLDHLDRLDPATKQSRMHRRLVKRPQSHRLIRNPTHDREGRRNPDAPVRNLDKPQLETNLISASYPMAIRESWGTLLKESMCKGKECKGCRGCKSCDNCKGKGSTCEKMGCA